MKKEFAKKEKEIQQQLQSQKRRESEPEPNSGKPLTSLNFNNENGSRDDDYKYQKSISQHDTLVKKHEILSTRQDNQQAPIRFLDAKLSEESIDQINVAKQSSGSPGIMKKIQQNPANAVSSSPKETKRGGNSKKKTGASSAFISSLLADNNIALQQKEGDSSPSMISSEVDLHMFAGGDTRAKLMLQRRLHECDAQAEENVALVADLRQQVGELQQALEEGFLIHQRQEDGLVQAQSRIVELENHLRVLGSAKKEVEAELAQRDEEVEQLCDAVDEREERICELKEMLRRVLESTTSDKKNPSEQLSPHTVTEGGSNLLIQESPQPDLHSTPSKKKKSGAKEKKKKDESKPVRRSPRMRS